MLPLLADVGDGKHAELDDPVDAVDLTETVPEKMRLPLQNVEFVGVVDTPPSVLRTNLQEMERVWSAPLANIQFDVGEDMGEKPYEVGSYAFRPEGWIASGRSKSVSRPVDAARNSTLVAL